MIKSGGREPVHVVGKLALVVFQRMKIDGRMREVKAPEARDSAGAAGARR